MKAQVLRVVVGACASISMGACHKDASTSTSDATPGTDAAAATPEPPRVVDDASNLVFSFLDARGALQAVSKTSDVPEAAKKRVLVFDVSKTPEQRQAHRYAFFADLTTQKPDGSYAVTTVSRTEALQSRAETAALPAPEGAVVVYSAVWCGFCKKAKAWLTTNNVPFIERDVEKTPGANAELQAKMKKAGVAGSGIPVIDWSGNLVVGFDEAELKRLLRDKPPTTGATPSPPTPPTGATP